MSCWLHAAGRAGCRHGKNSPCRWLGGSGPYSGEAAGSTVCYPKPTLLPRLLSLPAAAPGKLAALQAALQATDLQHSGLITLAAFQAALQTVDVGLSPHQTITIYRRLKENQHTGLITLAELGRLLQ